MRRARLVLPFVLWAGVAVAAPTPSPVYECSGRITTALRAYTEDVLHAVAGCRAKLLRSPGDSCLPNLPTQLENLADDVRNQIKGCSADAARALCALEAKTVFPALLDAFSSGPGSVRTSLTEIVDGLFVTPSGPGCPRPATPVDTGTRECADRIVQQLETATEQLEQCAFSCERANLISPSRSPCVDDITGDPIDDGVAECVARKTADLAAIAARCDDAEVVTLGCPLGATGVAQLVDRLGERVRALALDVNRRTFHSTCQGSLPGQPTVPLPARVTLEPSMRQRLITCGTVIDAEFLGRDGRVTFDEDLDCGPSQDATDGIVIARSGVTVSGRLRAHSIRGPRRSGLRTGAGIRIAPGVSRVRILAFKAIESFGVGIEDSPAGDNRKVVVQKTTVRRNVQAGVRLRSPRGILEQVTADKNGIGFDLSGDGTKLKTSSAKGSLYPPKVGIRLSGTDRNLNGVVVVANNNSVEGNGDAGIEIAGGGHSLSQNAVQANVGDGIVIREGASGSVVDSSNVKLNGRGIVVLGDANRLVSNTCEENLGPGFLVTGQDNVVEQNKSGKKSARGNAGAGFEVRGVGNRLYANQAEANLGPGFRIEATTALMKANGALANVGAGFELASPGNVVEACSAEANGGAEWVVAPGNTDRGGNKANGSTVVLPSDGGTCESRGSCAPGR